MGKMYQYVVAQLRLAKPVLQSNFEVMPSSLFLVATRAFVKVLLALARTYELALQVNRESSPEQLVKAYKKVVLRAHPDKGGRKEDVQKLQEAKETWEKARKAKEPRPQGGRPKTPTAPTQGGTLVTRRARKDYRVNTEVVLLTYSNFSDLQQWHRFVTFVRASLRKWDVEKWGATLEAYETEGFHTHLVLKFRKQVDRTSKSFAFEGCTPNVRKGDYLGEGLCKKR